MYCVKNEQMQWVVKPLSDLQVCTRLLFSSFGRHWYKVSLQMLLLHRSRQDGEIKSCIAQKRLSCERHVTELQRLRILDHHGSETTKNARQQWCGKCSSWKRADGTKCYCTSKESGNALIFFWADLSDASRQDLQATTGQGRHLPFDPLHVLISMIQTAIGRAEITVKSRREQLWLSQEVLTKVWISASWQECVWL